MNDTSLLVIAGLLFFSFIESVAAFTLMSSSIMRFRKPVKAHIKTALLVMIVGVCLLFFTIYSKGVGAVDNSAIIFILAIELAWYLICSDDNFFVSVFSFLTFVNIYISISYIGNILTSHYDNLGYVIAYIIIKAVIYAIIIPLLFKLVRPRFRKLVHTLDKQWRVATLVPLLFLILQVFLLYYPTPYWNWESNNYSKGIILIVYTLFLAIYYILYIESTTIVKKYTLEKRQLLMTQQNKLWESELSRQKATVAMAFQQHHDMHHHNTLIMQMLQNGDTDELITYMRDFAETLDVQNSGNYCSHPIINSILNTYERRATYAGIKTKFQLRVPEKMAIDNVDLTCVFGNSLENAMEGCLRLPQEDNKEIIVTAKFIDNRLRLQIENTCQSNIIFENDLPTTQKQNGGTGTKSIIYTAERYDGTAGFSVKNGKFITQIVLNAQ